MKPTTLTSKPLSLLALLLWASAAPLPAATRYSDLIKQDQPFLYWNFDEATNTPALQQIDTAPPTVFTSNDLLPFGAERVSHEALGSGLKLGNAAGLNGSAYFMASSLKTGTNLLAGPYIIEFWVQVLGANEGRRNDYLLNFGGGSGNQPAVLYDYVGSATPDNGLELFAGPRTDVGPELADELWHHVVIVYYGDGITGVADRADIYVDGSLAAGGIRGGFSAPLTVDSRFVVGSSAPQFAAGDSFEGRIDELAIYHLESLTDESGVTSKAEQIASHFASASAGGVVYADVVRADEPFVYWTFDEAEGPALEQTGRGAGSQTTGEENDLVPRGNVTRVGHDLISSGLKLGNAIELDGASYMRAADLNIPTNSLPPPYAIEFWIQVLGENEGILRNEYVLSMGESGGNEPALIYDYVGNGASEQFELFQCCGGNAGRSLPGAAVNDEGWHHVLVVFYGTETNGVSDRLEMYIDGVSDHQSFRNTYRQSLNLSSQFIVGSSPVVADAFTGRMDEVAIYDLATSTTEAAVEARATALATSHFAAASNPAGNYGAVVQADAPLLYWNFDEADGNAVQQIKPPVDRLVDNDLISVGADRVSHAEVGSGLDLGNAANFSGSSYFVAQDLSASQASLNAPWMVEFWVQVQGSLTTLRNDYLINFGGGGGNQPAFLYDYVGAAQARNGLEVFAGPRSGAGPVVTDAAWHHVAFVYFGNGVVGVADGLDVYLDGVKTSSSVRASFASSLALDSRLVVGTSAPQFAAGDGFEGRIDELAIYDFSGLTTSSAVAAKAEELVLRHYQGAVLPVENPSLEIAQVEGAFRVSWPLAAQGFVLEVTGSLSGADWQPVAGGVTISGRTRSVSLAPTAVSRFFRLRK